MFPGAAASGSTNHVNQYTLLTFTHIVVSPLLVPAVFAMIS